MEGSEPSPASPVPCFSPAQFLRSVRFIATDHTGAVFFARHALDRMAERDVTNRDVLTVLRRGELRDGRVTATGKPNEVKGVVCAPLDGGRKVGVVTILINNGKVFVKTVMWLDK